MSLTGKHRYCPRYDEHPNTAAEPLVEEQELRKIQRDLLLVRTYVYDICIHCGDVVARKKEPT